MMEETWLYTFTVILLSYSSFCCSGAQSCLNFVTPWTAARQASLSSTISQSLLKVMSIESVMPFNHLILCHSLLFLPSIFHSFRVFSNESSLHNRWPKYWSFSFSISPSNEYSGLISSRIDWFDLLAVQGTLKSLLQHHSSKASIFQHSAFFMVQLSHPYVTTGKTIAWLCGPLSAKWCLCFFFLFFPIPCNTMDYGPSCSSVLGILQLRIMEWVAIPFSRDVSAF